jgi:hypothetical protein
MKRTALLLIMIFTLVQLAPAVKAVIADTTFFFIADEEKSEEKGSTNEIKEKKCETDFTSRTAEYSHQLNTAFHLAEKIQVSPFPEKITPPPNFC